MSDIFAFLVAGRESRDFTFQKKADMKKETKKQKQNVFRNFTLNFSIYMAKNQRTSCKTFLKSIAIYSFMLYTGRTPNLGFFPAAQKLRPAVFRGLFTSAYRSSNVKKYNDRDNQNSQKSKSNPGISSYEYTQPLSGELQNIERFADEIDDRLNNQIELTIAKHTGEHLSKLREMLTERLHNYDIKNEAFTNVNKVLADRIRYITKDLNFEIYYPSREQFNTFALYTTKLFVYVDMILLDYKGKDDALFDENSKFLTNDSTYKFAEQISQDLKNNEVDKKKLFKTFIDGWLVKAKQSNDKIIAEIKKDEKILETISNPLNWFTKTKLYKRKFFCMLVQPILVKPTQP